MPASRNTASSIPPAGGVVSSPATRDRTSRPKHLGKITKPAARASRKAREAAGVSQQELAFTLDIPQSRIAEWESPDKPNTPPTKYLFDPDASSEYVRTFVAEIGSVHQFHVLDRVEVVHGENHFARLASLEAESGDVKRLLALSLANDGTLDLNELETVLPEIRQAMNTFLECEAWVVSEIVRKRAANGGSR